MNRDIDLCRSILIEVENKDDGSGVLINISRGQKVKYHIEILKDGGYLTESEVFDGYKLRLTNKGHDFLELSRHDERWNNAKSIVLKRTGGLSFELIVSLLSMEAMKSLRYDA